MSDEKEKKIYTCPRCGTTGVLYYQFYKVVKSWSPSVAEIKCKNCYAIVCEVDV